MIICVLDQRKYIPKYTFAILGGLFVLSNFLNYTGLRGSDVSGPIVVILQQVQTFASLHTITTTHHSLSLDYHTDIHTHSHTHYHTIT
jgi:hypothetical protein